MSVIWKSWSPEILSNHSNNKKKNYDRRKNKFEWRRNWKKRTLSATEKGDEWSRGGGKENEILKERKMLSIDLSNFPSSQIWHEVILSWEAMHKSRLMHDCHKKVLDPLGVPSDKLR